MSNALWPIAVPSLGRPGSTTHRLLADAHVRHSIFVEPHQQQDYQPFVGRYAELIVLPEQGQGIAFCRQYIKDWHTAQGTNWYWMLDDDITNFYLVDTTIKRAIEQPAQRVLMVAQDCIVRAGQCVAQAALEYRQFAWATRTGHVWDSYADVAVAINTQRTGLVHYDRQFLVKEDRDFTMQVLASGYRTLRVQVAAFSAPTNGTNNGGLKHVYDQANNEPEDTDRLVAKWPGIVTRQTKTNGRVDAKISWAALRYTMNQR